MISSRLKIAIGIATAGRRGILSETVEFLKQQSRLPDFLIICPLPSDGIDCAMFHQFPAQTKVVIGPSGLCAQRNMILAASDDADIIVFFDDDFLPHVDYLANLEAIFVTYPDIAALTGYLLADGANGPGLSVQEGLEILRSARHEYVEDFERSFGTYGCNMSFRLGPIRANNLRFDEQLPLYGWQEDNDFSEQQAHYGRTLKSNRLLGVHLGTKSGRTSGVRLGYSQIANPIYLLRKGTMSWKRARILMWRNVSANLVGSFYPEPWIDRKGRLKGNLIAMKDMFTRKLSPLRILQMD